MATLKPLYGSNNQSITITITSLANNGQQGSAAVDNTSNLYLDVLIVVIIKTNGSGTSATGVVNVYAAGTVDGGTNYTDGVTGTNAAQTLTTPPNTPLLGAINAVANAVTYVGGPWSLSGAFGGIIPDHWVIVVENKSSAALDGATGKAIYQGDQIQSL